MDEKLQKRVAQYEMMAFIVKEFIAELGKEKALAVVKRALEKLQVQTAKQWAQKAGGNSLKHLAEFLSKQAAELGTLEILDVTDKQIVTKIHRCVGFEAMDHLGIADVCRVYCDTDDLLIKTFNPNLKLIRTKTIAAGDGYCDHVWAIEE